ncbi:type II secretion system protein [Candidatus Hepatobacter penaei]|uniref:type II secretion system protein n=1 Tax=Candidatus Hepatobacter penaei TaxID=1274402 RepID=UPI0009E3E210|nr:type II secretion system protein [Candidatus Hepatobacter penaei]
MFCWSKVMFRRHQNASTVKGFSLVEMALVLAILGIVSSGLFRMLSYLWTARQEKNTQDRQERVFKALGQYVRRTGQLPCPADPSDLVNWGKARPRCQSPVQAYGIVPFQTLGLSEGVSKNGAGVFFTYIVHPGMTLRGSLSVGPQQSYCKKHVEPLFTVVHRHGAQASPDGDPIVLVLLSHNSKGEGAFWRGRKKRKPYKNSLSFNQLCGSYDFKCYESAPKRRAQCQTSLRTETKCNLASYYGGFFCDE